MFRNILGAESMHQGQPSRKFVLRRFLAAYVLLVPATSLLYALVIGIYAGK